MSTGMIKALVLLAIVAAVLGWGEWKEHNGREEGREQVQAAWDFAEFQNALLRAARIAKGQAVTQGLQDLANDERNKREKAETARAADRQRFLSELRDRPSRDDRPEGLGDVPGPAGARPAGCGGARGDELGREDAGVLEGQFDLARRITADRDTCRTLYNKARDEIRRLKGQPP